MRERGGKIREERRGKRGEKRRGIEGRRRDETLHPPYST